VRADSSSPLVSVLLVDLPLGGHPTVFPLPLVGLLVVVRLHVVRLPLVGLPLVGLSLIGWHAIVGGAPIRSTRKSVESTNRLQYRSVTNLGNV
jgi:hypothetical protein